MARRYGIGKVGVAIVAALTLMATLASGVGAQGIYTTAGATGYDISYPQCGGTYSTLGGQFGIVGVTSGHAFRHNACFGDEYTWASGKAIHASVYMNLNYAIGKTAAGNTVGPASCAKGDKACQAYNYGWNAAKDAYEYAANQLAIMTGPPLPMPTMWWLDIETANSWSSTASLNRADIQGAIDYLQKIHMLTVGVYSTASMWQTITGSWNTSVNGWNNTSGQSALPAWDGVGGTTRCASPSFTGGPAWLVQATSNGYDVDTAC